MVGSIIMKKDNFNKKIYSFLSKKNKSKKKINNKTKIFEEEILDSLGIIDLIFFLEREFKIKLEDKDISAKKLQNVDSIVKLIEKKLR